MDLDYAPEFLQENRAFAQLISEADESSPVPTCPGWNLKQLVRHLGRGDRWAAQIVSERRDTYLDPRNVEGGKPPPDPKDVASWLQGGAQRLVDAVELSGVETPVWTFLGSRPADWWIRRRLHETVVHRADAAIAIGADFTLRPRLAADAITEFLERLAVQAGSNGTPLPLQDDNTLHLHATDADLGEDGEWTISIADGAVTWSPEHGKGTAALRGGATDLLLAMVRRVSLADTGIEMFGDDTVWQDWLDHTPL